MSRLRRDTQSDAHYPRLSPRSLRIVTSGTLFLTYTLSVSAYPEQSTTTRAQSVRKTRGGSASTLASLLAQFPYVEAVLVAALGGNDEGKAILRDLEKEGVITRYCKLWQGLGVPSAWVLHAADTGKKTVINHNPLPDITHEEFVSILGPLLAPENYLYPSPSASPTTPGNSSHSGGPPSPRTNEPQPPPQLRFNPNSPAPFDWLHFEGRSVKTTLSNMTGLDGLARERKWRSHCVFSLDVGRKSKQGVEALIPHADVLFLNKHYAQIHSPHYASSPRSFLLSLTSIAPPHALLVAHWGSEGAAVLSLPTREYFQSSGWVEENPVTTNTLIPGQNGQEARSVRSGSDFWAGNRSNHTPSSSAFTAANLSDAMSGMGHMSSPSFTPRRQSRPPNSSNYHNDEDEDDNDSQGTEVPEGQNGGMKGDSENDEIGAQDAFVAGMIYALSRKISPGPPYTPSAVSDNATLGRPDNERGRWRLDECLRFAIELSGRKARRRNWEGLADEMARASWFDS